MTALSASISVNLSASISVNDVTMRYNTGTLQFYDVSFALQGGNNLCPCRRKWKRKINAIQKHHGLNQTTARQYCALWFAN